MIKGESFKNSKIPLDHWKALILLYRSQAKLEAQLNLNREEAESRQKRLEQELNTIVSKQQELEKTNAELQRKSGDVRQWLHQLQISDTEYEKLASLKEDSLTLKDNVAVSILDLSTSYVIATKFGYNYDFSIIYFSS